MAWLRELDGNQIRQMIDTEQALEAWSAARTEKSQRFSGSMTWKRVGGREYLYRKTNGTWKSLGARGSQTEEIIDRFRSGRDAVKTRIDALDEALRRLALVNRAMRLGRVPWAAARVLRKLQAEQLLGRAVSVVGTHALFAYERMAGVHFDSSQVTTADIDLLYDARRTLKLATPETAEGGLRAILRAADESFEPVTPGAYRAVNRTGFMVDLIAPLPRQPALSSAPLRIGSDPSDLTAAQIEGLTWLQNSPQVLEVAIDEKGFPVPIAAPDPRAFALHKLWVAERPDRDRMKARRDAEQARAVAGLLLRYLPHLRFDDPALAALPMAVRARTPDLIDQARRTTERAEDW